MQPSCLEALTAAVVKYLVRKETRGAPKNNFDADTSRSYEGKAGNERTGQVCRYVRISEHGK